MANPSLTGVLPKIARDYARQKEISIGLVFDDTPTLIQHIVDGESADLIIADDPNWITHLKFMGLIDVYSRTNLLRNRLVLVTREDNPVQLDLSRHEAFIPAFLDGFDPPLLVMPPPDDQIAGTLGREAFEYLGLWKDMKESVVYASSTRDILRRVRQENTLGLIYHTEAVDLPDIRIADVLDAELHAPLIFQAAVVAGENMALAREFLAYLRTEPVQQQLEGEGWLVN